MPNDKQAPKELKVTDKRIFTAEGEIREEFKDIKPAEPQAAKPAPPPVSAPVETPPPEPKKPAPEERRKRPADPEQIENPATPFALFAEQLIAQAYMLLGMLRNPYQPQPKVDAAAARQMIDILTMLQEKTQGNLTPEEEDFLTMHLGELKLAFVQRTKSI